MVSRSRRNPLHRSVVVSVLVLLITLVLPGFASAQVVPSTSAPSADVPSGTAPAPMKLSELPADGHFAPDPGPMIAMAQSGVITAGWCRYRQAIDDPHLSGGEASIHGSWIQAGGICPALANVDTYLQAYWCDSWGCRWITVDFDSRDIRSGGGRGKRGNARKACATSRYTGWRGVVDVDLIGVNDPAGFTYSASKNLYCAPT